MLLRRKADFQSRDHRLRLLARFDRTGLHKNPLRRFDDANYLPSLRISFTLVMESMAGMPALSGSRAG